MNTTTSWDDEKLMIEISAGKTEALAILYDRYGRLVYSLAYHVVCNTETAEEVTQDVFTQVWNKANIFNPTQGKVMAWLASMARHRAIDMLRQLKVRPEGHSEIWTDEALSGFSRDGTGPEHETEVEQQKETMQRAMLALPLEQRKVLFLAYFSGYSHQQIADALQEPLGTVKTRLRLAMQKLRQIIAESPAFSE